MSDVQTMQLYCVADPVYFEAPEYLPDTATRYALDADPLPPGWRRSRSGLWTQLRPAAAALPEQGWKIHISVVPERAASTLSTVAEICFARQVPFKFLRSEHAVRFGSDKYMARASSGKFVTAYPADDRQFAALVEDLAAALDGSPGPYILSDLRIGHGPVYVRYGAFIEQWCAGPGGTPVRALRDPEGHLVPDDRRPVFRVPSWVRLPEFLRPHLAARAAGTDPDFPYRVLRSLHFTNGGGTYLAQHRDTGQQVVLREARPYAGLDGTGTDALTRLRREYEALSRLEGLDCVPRVHGLWRVWEHEFLVEEYIDGLDLLHAVIYRYPHRFVHPSPAAVEEYLRWVDRIVDGLARALEQVHGRGVTFGDLHPGNVIVRPDDTVALVDFEYAGGDPTTSAAFRVGAAGFAAPREATGAEADRYSLRAVWLMMLMPLAELADHDPGKAAMLESLALQRFGLPSDAGPRRPNGRAPGLSGASGESVVRELFADPTRHWPEIRDQLVAGILAAATPERADRLFPADPRVFDAQGPGLAHGASGVLRALHAAGIPVPEQYTDWLVDAARRAVPDARPGLFEGLPGVASLLYELGRRDDALELLSAGRAVPAPVAGLYSGQAGTALNHCHLADLTGDDGWLDDATRIAHRLDMVIRGGSAGELTLPPSAGLLHGMAGAALLHLRLYRTTGDEDHLRACRRALAHELGHCVPMEDGTVQVKDGNRHLFYIDGGSGGIALVAQEYLAHREDPELSAFVAAVRRGCGNEHVREPGLFQGRAGLLAIMSRLSGPEHHDEMVAQAGRLGVHAVHRDGALLIPGRRLRRCSADLATGAAGVLLALHAAFEEPAGLLPLVVPGARGSADTAAIPAIDRFRVRHS